MAASSSEVFDANLTIGESRNVQLARISVLSVSAAARSHAGIDAAYTFKVVDERA